MNFRKEFCISLLLIILLTPFCKVRYDMSGSSLDVNVKTISIQFFSNQAPIVQPTLSQEFTEAMKDRFRSQTNLNLISGIGDINFEGEIKGYDVRPQDIQGDETAATNRLTVTVHVKFTNVINPKQDFDTNFSRYADYDSNRNLDDVAKELNKKIIDELTEDIFNKSVVNW